MINTDTMWTHNREGYEVRIIALNDGIHVIKGDNEANWRDEVHYYRLDDVALDTPEAMIYHRSEEDFLAKFSPSEEGDCGK